MKHSRSAKRRSRRMSPKRRASRRMSFKRRAVRKSCRKQLKSKRKSSYQKFVQCGMKHKSLSKISPQRRMKLLAKIWKKSRHA